MLVLPEMAVVPICVMESESPSGSESVPLPSLSVMRLPLSEVTVSSVIDAVLLVAFGERLSTVQVNDWETVSPASSVAVMVTLYGPPADASESMVPVISPVSGSIDSPGGNVPLSSNASVSFAIEVVKEG